MHSYGVVLAHSAKGSEWKDHKYIRKKNGTYYYLDENGNETTTTHKEGSSKSDSSDKKDEKASTDKKEDDKNVSAEAKKLIDSNIKSEDLTPENVEKLAKEVIRGGFGNGQERKDLLGEHYATIQKRVNELMKGYSKEALADATKKKSEENKTDTKKKSTKKKSSKKKTTTTTRSSGSSSRKNTNLSVTTDKTATVIKHECIYDGSAYIIHGGPGSGRFPLGSGERPYQRRGGGRSVRAYEADSYKPKKIGFHKKSEIQKTYSKQKRSEMAEKAFSRNIKDGKDKPNTSLVEKSIKDTKKAVDSSKDVVRTADRVLHRKERDKAYSEAFQRAQKMSDQDLRNFINRKNLEKQYVNSLDIDTLSRGQQRALDVLDIAGDVLGVAGGAAALGVSIYEFTHRK